MNIQMKEWLAISFVALLSACAPDGVVLHDDAVGEVGTVTRTEAVADMSGGQVRYEIQGVTVEGEISTRVERIVESRVLDDSVIRHLVEKDRTDVSMDFLGQRLEEQEAGKLEGIAVLGEKTNGQWSYRFEEGEPTVAQQAELHFLEKWTRAEDMLYPKHPVRVGEQWELEPEIVALWVGSGFTEILDSSGQGFMELVEITRRDGREVARLSFNLDGRVIARDDEAGEQDVEMVLEGEVFRALDTLEDIHSQAEGRVRIEGKISEQGMEIGMSVDAPLRTTSSVTRPDISETPD